MKIVSYALVIDDCECDARKLENSLLKLLPNCDLRVLPGYYPKERKVCASRIEDILIAMQIIQQGKV